MLIKKLALIAAKELKNTRGIHPQYKEQLRLVEAAYGGAAVESDFYSWTQEVKANPPEYPISDYLKIVDKRLAESAGAPELDDSRVTEISAVVLELTDRLPQRVAVEKALKTCSQNELTEAFREYAARLDEKELKYAPRDFFNNGGYEAVLAVRKKKELELNDAEAMRRDAENYVAARKALLDAEDELNEERRKAEEALDPNVI